MPRLLTLPDTFYQQAAEAIADIRRRNEPNIDAGDIEKVLRSYVYLGVNKQIVDWNYKLSEEDQFDIVTRVVNRTQTYYGFRPDTGRTFTNLRTMETLAGIGQVNPNVARPRAAQEAYEAQQEGGFKAPGVVDTLKNTVTDIFGTAKQTIEAALKGLGLDIPFEVLLIAVVLLIVSVNRPRVAV